MGCLHFVRGPLPMAGAVFFSLRWSWWLSLRLALRIRTRFLFSRPGVRVGFTVSSSYVFLRDGVILWVNSVFLSLLIANEGLHCWLFLSVLANPFWGGVGVFLRPPWVCRHFLWLVAALLPGFSLSFASGAVFSSPQLLLRLCLRYADWLSLWLCVHGLLGLRVSWPSCLSLALQLALVLQVPVGFLLPYGSHPSRWGRDLFVLDWNEGFVCFPFPFGLFLHVVPALGVLVTKWVCDGRFLLLRDRRYTQAYVGGLRTSV